MSAKHTFGSDLEKYLSNEVNANGLSREVIYDELDSLQDQRLLRKVDLRWHFKSTYYLVSADSHFPRLLPILTLLFLLSFLDRFVYFLSCLYAYTDLYLLKYKHRKCQVSAHSLSYDMT